MTPIMPASSPIRSALLAIPKLMIAGVLLLAFLAGALFEGFTKYGVTNASSACLTPSPAMAYNPSYPNGLQSAPPTEPAMATQPDAMQPYDNMQPVPAPPPVQSTVTERTSSYAYSQRAPVHHHRSLKKQALIVGGSAAGGAAIGAIAGGGKGAGIGALAGGGAGLIYDLATKNK